MKRIDRVRKVEQAGCLPVRHGDCYHSPQTNASQPIPRHREIKESLAKHILRKLGID